MPSTRNKASAAATASKKASAAAAASAASDDDDISAQDMVSDTQDAETATIMDAIAQWVYYRILMDNIEGVPPSVAGLAIAVANFHASPSSEVLVRKNMAKIAGLLRTHAAPTSSACVDAIKLAASAFEDLALSLTEALDMRQEIFSLGVEFRVQICLHGIRNKTPTKELARQFHENIDELFPTHAADATDIDPAFTAVVAKTREEMLKVGAQTFPTGSSAKDVPHALLTKHNWAGFAARVMQFLGAVNDSMPPLLLVSLVTKPSASNEPLNATNGAQPKLTASMLHRVYTDLLGGSNDRWEKVVTQTKLPGNVVASSTAPAAPQHAASSSRAQASSSISADTSTTLRALEAQSRALLNTGRDPLADVDPQFRKSSRSDQPSSRFDESDDHNEERILDQVRQRQGIQPSTRPSPPVAEVTSARRRTAADAALDDANNSAASPRGKQPRLAAETNQRSSGNVSSSSTPSKPSHPFRIPSTFTPPSAHSPQSSNEQKDESRARVRWSDVEVRNLIDGFRRFGKSWTQILGKYKFASSRTSVDLKDKFRNLEKAGQI
ncbi:hypothetical protein CAOG_007935 [Capsaspora owczarzaki ATCC 30864]|uniref:Uncharacterized protein n=2 Tax=Capsaspora owczarzaki (strain ATCC 30864) TaxID=595528 RepID=A0A0D2WY94_CAPO3|nr:hypothetical protein CAOG_007935 [Capsaspora owczarzaki ATCC 30864]